MAHIDDVKTAKFSFIPQTDIPATPTSSYITVFFKDDGKLYSIDEYGTVTPITVDTTVIYTASQVDELLSLVYTKSEVDAIVANIYTKSEVDVLLSNVYTKSETDALLANIYTKSEVYSKAELNTTTDGTSGADQIGATPISLIGAGNTTVQSQMEAAVALLKTRALAFYIGKDLEVNDQCSLLIPYTLSLVNVEVGVETAPTGANIIVDFHRTAVGGSVSSTIFTTTGNRPTILAGGYTSSVAVPDIVSFLKGDRLHMIVDQIGSTVSGSKLTGTFGGVMA